MNTAYDYKNERKNTNSYNINSKKGTLSRASYSKPKSVGFAEKYLSLIDMIIEALSSARLLVGAKAFFGFVILLGFLGVIGGVELGSVSLIVGIVAVALLVGAEFLILKD